MIPLVSTDTELKSKRISKQNS